MTTTEEQGAEKASDGLQVAAIAPLLGKLRQREEWTDDERQVVLDELFPADERVIPYAKRFGTLIVLSATIAAFGLIADSAAVVIGAMLVAPLMTPMLALAASLMYWHVHRLVGSLVLIVLGTIGAVGTGWIAARIAGGTPPVVVAGDVAAAFNDRPEVMEFLAYLSTAEAGEPWAELGGFTSPHSDFDVAAYADEFDRRMGEMIAEAPVVRFDGSDEMDPAVGSGTFWSGMRTFVRTANIQLAVEEIQAGYGQPAASETDESS
jgi:hypothetical protein